MEPKNHHTCEGRDRCVICGASMISADAPPGLRETEDGTLVPERRRPEAAATRRQHDRLEEIEKKVDMVDWKLDEVARALARIAGTVPSGTGVN